MQRFCAPIRPLVTLIFPAGGQLPACVLGGLVLLCALSDRADAQSSPPQQAPPPTIEGFEVVNLGGNKWSAEGYVIDPDPGDVEVYFGGLLQGCWIMTNPDGSFCFTFTLPTGTWGEVSAEALDSRGLWSGEADCFIPN